MNQKLKNKEKSFMAKSQSNRRKQSQILQNELVQKVSYDGAGEIMGETFGNMDEDLNLPIKLIYFNNKRHSKIKTSNQTLKENIEKFYQNNNKKTYKTNKLVFLRNQQFIIFANLLW